MCLSMLYVTFVDLFMASNKLKAVECGVVYPTSQLRFSTVSFWSMPFPVLVWVLFHGAIGLCWWSSPHQDKWDSFDFACTFLDHVFSVKDLGQACYFWGVELAMGSHGLYLSQHKYTMDIVTDVGLLDAFLLPPLFQRGLHLSADEGPFFLTLVVSASCGSSTLPQFHSS